jgi:hypothetical protein
MGLGSEFMPPAPLVTGQLEFSLLSLPGKVSVIYASTNLVNWRPARFSTNLTGTVWLTNAMADCTSRFFRAPHQREKHIFLAPRLAASIVYDSRTIGEK